MSIGLWLTSNFLLCLRAAILVLVNFVVAVFLAADTVTFFLIVVPFPFGAVRGKFFFVNLLGLADRRVIAVMDEMSIDLFVSEDAESMSSIDVEELCCGFDVVAMDDAVDGPGALRVSVGSCLLTEDGFSRPAAFDAWAFSFCTGLSGASSESEESVVLESAEGLSCGVGSSALFWLSRMASEFASRSQIAADVSVVFLRSRLSLHWVRLKPRFPTTSHPSRLTVLELITRISFSVVSQCPDCSFIWIAPVTGISKFLKHLYFVEQSLGSFQLEDLQFCSTLLASPLLTMLLGLPVSASQSISVWYDVVRIQISSDKLEECLVGDSFLNVFWFNEVSCIPVVKRFVYKEGIFEIFWFVVFVRLGISVRVEEG